MNDEKTTSEAIDDNTPAAVTIAATLWFRNKKTLLIVSAVSLIVIAGVVFFLLNGKSRNSVASTDQQEPSETTAESGPIEKVAAEGIPGITFTIPKHWTVNNVKHDNTLIIYTDDAEASTEAYYIDINRGNSIRIHSKERDAAAEADKDDPLDAYAQSVGSPRINNGSADFSEWPTDFSKYKKFTSKNGIKMVAYPWSYEGCFEQVVFLSEKLKYSLEIYDGAGCPDNEILTTNPKIKNFLDSIEFTDGTPKLEFEGAYIVIDDDKTSTVSQVQMPGLSFAFAGSENLDNFYLLRNTPMLVSFSSADKFEKLLIGSPRSTFEKLYDCDGCGAVWLYYDEMIAYSQTAASTDGYEKLSDIVYGKKVSVEPIQADYEAATFSYIKILPSGSFTYTVTMEVLTPSDMPQLNNEQLIKMIGSLQIL